MNEQDQTEPDEQPTEPANGARSDLTVLLCSDYLLPSSGGVEVVVESLARGLAERGVDLSVLTLESSSHAEPALSDHPDISVYQLPTVDLTNLIGLQGQVSPVALHHFGKIIDETDPDVIHLHNRFFFTTLAGVCWSAVRHRNIPLVTTLHLGSIDAIRGAVGIVARLYERTVGRAILRRSSAVITVSDAVASHALRLGADPEGLTTIPNGVDANHFHPTDRTTRGKTVLFVGRLVRNKGPHIFVRSFERVIETHPDATARIIGTGPMRDELQEQVKAAGLSENIEFIDYVEDIADSMRDADVFCRPSLSEGMPLTLLEAMSTGLPPVVTPIAGVPEVVNNGKTGILIQQNDVDALADALCSVLDDPERATAMGEAARQCVAENYEISQRHHAVLSVYDDILGKRYARRSREVDA